MWCSARKPRPAWATASPPVSPPARPDAAGWLVALADMPFIQPDTLHRVAAALADGAELAAPVFNGQRGHPVGFAARWRDALLALQGDEGARALVGANRLSMRRIATDDPGVLRDVDRPEDLAS